VARRLHPAVLATAIALPVALVVGVVVAAVLAQRAPAREDVALGTVPAPAATSGPCTALLPALPQELDGLVRATLAQPAPEGAVAWQPADPAAAPSDPVVLRCGIDRPAEFDVAAPLVVVDGVQVLEIPGDAVGIAATTYVVVDRGVYIGITLPDGSGSGALQQITDVVRDTLPAQPLDPAPIG
jgi:hypothetical protein